MLTRYPFDNPSDWFRNELRNFFSDTGTWSRGSRGSWPTAGQRGTRRTRGVFPAVNIYDDGESYMVRAELPGIDKEKLDISAKEDQIVIRGERAIKTAGDDANYHRREREGGEFRRAVSLPQTINNDKVMASYQNGVLEIRAPRSERSKPKKIEVKS